MVLNRFGRFITDLDGLLQDLDSLSHDLDSSSQFWTLHHRFGWFITSLSHDLDAPSHDLDASSHDLDGLSQVLDYLHARLGLLLPKINNYVVLKSIPNLLFEIDRQGDDDDIRRYYISIKVLRAYLLIVLSYTDTVEAVVSQETCM